MSIRWQRDHKRKAQRSWYLVCTEKETTYMKVEYLEFPLTGWSYTICNKPTEQNVVKGIWDTDLGAQREAALWWKANREQHLAKFWK